MRHGVDWLKFDCNIPDQAIAVLLQAGTTAQRFLHRDLYPGQENKEPAYDMEQKYK